ncbi:MAG: DNA polymerase/3'-5' exonuclease PolX [Chloroflexi bacterium]|nr:DNA polymerase/3'-5' exonuclease PolX [Chloroflexota bacterium]
MMNNAQIAEVFENIAGLLELKGESVFKIRAYQRAARTIEHLPVELARYVQEGKELRELPGIGEAISKKVQELLSTGRLQYYEGLKSEFPDGLLKLMDVPGVGPKTAMRICQDLGISTVEALEKAAQDGRLAELPRLGQKSAENILRHIRSLRSKEDRILVGRALPLAEEVMAELRQRCPGIGHINAAGSLRRWRETVGDIDIMGTACDPEQVIDALVKLPMVVEVLAHGPKKASVYVQAGVQIDLRFVPEEAYGSLLQYFTGSQQHNIRLRDYANRMGLSLSEYGIKHVDTGEVEQFSDEEAFYSRLGLQYIPPELREGGAEIELAARGALPPLVTEDDIRGDLHVHTDWSDGRQPLEVMLQAAAARGYQYVAITDHSAGRGIANGLSPERLREQVRLLRSLDGRFNGMRVLCGSEVDIRADGSLDYPDELLAELDVVVASVHSSMAQPADKMTERIIRAMRNKYVTVIGHPSTRLLGSRDPIDADWEALFRAAAETGTVLEVNSSPERLDLKDLHAMRARELGAPLLISTDAHATGHLANMRFGVHVARRAWCQARDILNTLPREEFLRGLGRKRAAASAV